jgi:tetratricopeptide (TPR) repeat protein
MTGTRTKLAKLAASSAMIAVLLSGCSMNGSGDRPSGFAAKPLSGTGNKAVDKAERAVAANPRDAAARAVLGAAYLDAGRFASAVQSYDDALDLGDESVATVLGLALAETAQGNYESARELLRDWRDVIPASDLGLAYALAGDTARGVEILGAALRAGENTPKLRQNLAFAFALDGHWREARLMAMQDIPAGQIDARISEWAQLGRSEDARARVAHLLGVTPAADAGQPQALALANFPSVEQLAMEAQTQFAAAPAVAPVETAPVAPPVQQAALELPVAAPVAAPVAPPIMLASIERAPVGIVRDTPALVVTTPVPASRPSVSVKPRAVGKFVAEAHAAVKPGKGRGLAAMAPAPKVVAGGSHWVQLGSYTDAAVAKDGWRKFVGRTPGLKPYRQVTTTATVDGAQVWRVAAAGFASYADAARMCAAVKARGGACLVKRAESPSVAVAGRSGMSLVRR